MSVHYNVSDLYRLLHSSAMGTGVMTGKDSAIQGYLSVRTYMRSTSLDYCLARRQTVSRVFCRKLQYTSPSADWVAGGR
jgi:hypothetical protein